MTRVDRGRSTLLQGVPRGPSHADGIATFWGGALLAFDARMHRLAFILVLACGASHSPAEDRPDARVDASMADAFVADAFVPDVFVPDAPDSPDATTSPDATALPDATTPDAATLTSGVPCGAMSCEAPIAVCVVCPHEDFTDSHCYPADLDSEWPFGPAMEAHGGCGFPGVFVQCDGPEDCVRDDQECVFDGGEWGYARCATVTPGSPIACRTDDDCESGARCGEVDPFGYFSEHFTTLGWRPYACGGASREASAFCDEWDAMCGDSPGFFDRAQCLRTHDDAWEGGEAECARRHVARGACEAAAGANPCDA